MRLYLATDDEIAEIQEIDRREFPSADWPDSSVWWTIDHDPDLGYAGACVAGDPLERHADPVLHLTRGVVCPDLRGRGWQARMIRTRLAWGRLRGCTSAQTYTWHDNVPSMRNLVRGGFFPLRAREGFIRWERPITLR